MELKTLLGDAYKEGMTVDEINAAIKDKEFIDKSSLKPSVEKSIFDSTASELAAAKKKLKELETKTLTDEEKINLALKEASDTKSEFNKKLSEIAAKEIFIGLGLQEADYKDLLDIVIKDNVEDTKAAATKFSQTLTKQKEAQEKAIKAELLKNAPQPPAGNGTLTIAELDKKIAEAGEAGRMPEQAALIRQKNELLSKK